MENDPLVVCRTVEGVYFPHTLTDGVTKVPEGCPGGFWHFWHLLTLGFSKYRADLLSLRERGFDVVVCYSGPMSYVFDQPNFALEVRLRVTRPNKHPGAFDAGPHIITVVGRD
jgi:hypothetical protein